VSGQRSTDRVKRMDAKQGKGTMVVEALIMMDLERLCFFSDLSIPYSLLLSIHSRLNSTSRTIEIIHM
jgi:hypothetical protein